MSLTVIHIVPADSTAILGQDYPSPNITATFEAGEEVVLVNVTLINDEIDEPMEVLQLSLDPIGYGQVIGSPLAYVYINDEEGKIDLLVRSGEPLLHFNPMSPEKRGCYIGL